MELEGKTALVTGSTSGIGKATASALAQVAHLAQEAGAVDILVNNAGRSWFGPTADLDAGTFDALVGSDIRSAYLLTAAIASAMAARGSGSIINLDSMAGAVGAGRRRGLRRVEGVAVGADACVGSRVQSGRSPGQRRRAGSGLVRRSLSRGNRQPGDDHPARPGRPSPSTAGAPQSEPTTPQPHDRKAVPVSSNVYAVSFDAHDAQTAASFWAAVLDLITSDFDAEIDRPPGPPPPS